MKDVFREDIWKAEEYSYEAAYGFVPNLHFYIHDDDEADGQKARSFMIIVPGGGYCMVVPPEAEIVAKVFCEQGMNCAVLTYTTDITMCVPLHKQPMNDASRAVRYIRKHAARLHADPDKIVICGFSAGGHVCGSLGVHYEDVKDPDPEFDSISNRPDAMILSYPVITSGEFTHIYSMWALIGKDGPKEEYDYFSLEKHVTEKTPPTFLWQTVTDDLVPVENSAFFADACRAAKVPYAYYAFPAGAHGLSVCTEAWRKGDFGEPYTMEQVERAFAAVREGRGIRVPDARRQELMEQFKNMPGPVGPDSEGEESEKTQEDAPAAPAWPEAPEYNDVVLWPKMAKAWMERIW